MFRFGRRASVILAILVGFNLSPLSCLFAQSATTPKPAAPAARPPAAAPAQPLQDLVATLSMIDPYRPTSDLSGTVHVYGSTAMDNLAHAWDDEFKQFHPEVQVEIAAAGSGDAFEQLKKNPQAMVMLSRPVKPEELEELKSDAIQEPVAFVVCREALGVFVHADNPIPAITGEQLRAVFTKQTKDADLKWKMLGVSGPLAEQPIHLVLRSETSGTQSFLREFVFGGMEMRTASETHGSNNDVLGALAQDPLAITICGLRANGYGVRSLPLVSRGVPIPSTDADVLKGRYPLTRNLTVVVDMGQKGAEATAAQQLVRFALCRSGQVSAIRAGFFPAELSTLKAGLSLLQRDQLR